MPNNVVTLPAVAEPHRARAAAARRVFTSFVSVFLARRLGSAPALTRTRTSEGSMRAAAACTAP